MSRISYYGFEPNKVYFLKPKNKNNEVLYKSANTDLFRTPFLVLETVKTDITNSKSKLTAPKKIQYAVNGKLVTVEITSPEASRLYLTSASLNLIGEKAFNPRCHDIKFKKGRTYRSYWGCADEILKTIGSQDANQKCCAFRNFIRNSNNHFTVLKVDNIGVVEAIGSQGRIYTRSDSSAFLYHDLAWFFNDLGL